MDDVYDLKFTSAPPTDAFYGSKTWYTPTATSSCLAAPRISVSGACTKTDTGKVRWSGVGECITTAAVKVTPSLTRRVTQTITVDKVGDCFYLLLFASLMFVQATQEISFSGIDSGSVIGDSLTPVAVSSSSLATTLGLDPQSVSEGICSLADGMVSLKRGECIIVATQGGDANYKHAKASHSVFVDKKSPNLNLDAIRCLKVKQQKTITFTVAEGVEVTLTKSGPCTLAGNKITRNQAQQNCFVIAKTTETHQYKSSERKIKISSR